MNRIKVAYGAHPEQFGHLYLPEGAPTEPVPVVAVIHGGSWSGRYALNLGTQYAVEFARAGFAAWNIEYRRIDAGGAWPEISSDVLAAVNAIGDVVQEHSALRFDMGDVRLIGHSAGGHLAMWAAGQEDSIIELSRVVCQAGVLDLTVGPAKGIVSPVLEELLGVAYDDDPEAYRAASPIHLLPTGIPVRCIHGGLDVQVPVSQSERYVAAAVAAGDTASLTVVDGEDHFSFLRPGSECWKQSLAAVLD